MKGLEGNENLYDPMLAYAIRENIVHGSYMVQIHGKSMRKCKKLME